MVEKLRECFDEMVVYKDLKKSNFFSALSLPSFLRDWLLKKFEDEDDFFDALRAAGDSNSDKLIKLAEEIGKDELIAIVLDYDYSLKWAINQILN